jgi:hypothetical protein
MCNLVPRRKGFVEQQCAEEICDVKEEESVNMILIGNVNEMAKTAYIGTYRREYKRF